MIEVSNLGGGEIFRTRPYQPWGPPILLYKGYRLSFVERGVDHPPAYSAEVKERVELTSILLLGLHGLLLGELCLFPPAFCYML
jgi:hypothetical protein